MTYLDQKRAQAQKMYEEEQKYWRENAEEFKKYVPLSFLPPLIVRNEADGED
jgi:hypothetical protein